MVFSPHPKTFNAAPANTSLRGLFFGVLTIAAVAMVWATLLFWLKNRMGFDHERFRVEAPFDTIFFLALTFGLGIGTWIAAKLWQNRDLVSLIGRGSIAMRHFVVAAATTWSVAAVLAVCVLPFSEPLIANLDIATWIRWVPLALLVILLQTGSEELLFRGYLQGHLAMRFRNPLIWLVFPAILFGAAHFLPDLPLSVGLTYVAFAVLFGLIAGDLAAQTGTIGAGWGMHFANNTIAILIVVTEGSVTGLGLYRTGSLADMLAFSPLLFVDLVVMILVWLLVRRLVSR